ncbi:Fur family transcriptional regulator [Chloroflexota bacterium]
MQSKGLRLTRQRKLILDILERSDGHLDAYQIYHRARNMESRLSLSTVYRTLAVLKETGLVRELHLDDEHHHYELDRQDEHSHLVCATCGRVVEVESRRFAKAAQAVGQDHDFLIANTHVELTGYCVLCRQLEIA